jgi:hypothetical protein
VHPVLALGLVMIAGAAAMRMPRWPAVPHRLALVRAGAAPLLLLGVFLGPGSGVLDPTTQRLLAPVMAMGIGWLGAAFAARLDRRWLAHLPRRVWQIALLQSLTTFTIVAGAAALCTRAIPGLAPIAGRRATILLGALALVAAPALVARATRLASLGPRAARRLRAVATLESALGVLIASVALGGLGRFHGIVGVAAGLAGGAALGVILVGLARVLSRDDLGVPLPGVVLVAAGLGMVLGVSPLLVCAAAAATATYLSPRRRDLARRLGGWERALVAVLFILAGARLGWPTAWLLVAALVVAIARLGSWFAAVWPTRRLGAPAHPWAAQTQGPLAIALAVSIPLTRPGATGEMIFTIVALVVVVSQLVGAIGMAPVSRPREL